MVLLLNSQQTSPICTALLIFTHILSSYSSSTSEMLFIRHGRSRVRHSNEKDHIRWGLKAFDNLTLEDYDVTDGYDNDTVTLFGSDLWANENTTYINQTNVYGQSSRIINNNNNNNNNNSDNFSNNVVMTTQMPSSAITFKKKLQKKKIMENIRKNVNKGLEYLKMHKNLQEDDLKKSTDINPEVLEGYQNDDGNHLQSPEKNENVEKLYDRITAEQNPLENAKSYLSSGVLDGGWDGGKDTVSSPNLNRNTNNISESDEVNRNSTRTILARPMVALYNKQQLVKHHEDENNSPEGTGDDSGNRTVVSLNLVGNNEGKDGKDGKDGNSSTIQGGLFLHDGPNQSVNSSYLGSSGTRRDNSKIDPDIREGMVGDIDSGYDGTELTENNDEINNEEDDDNSIDDENGNIDLEDDEVIAFNVHGTTDEDLSDLDEISRNNRLNLMKGRDVVTKFLQIVESQHLLGANCTAGTALNLGEGVVDQYAQDRFRIEAEVAVNRANMLTRIFKLASSSVQASEHLLHASVLSMVEFDDDIFAAGNCFDWNQHPAKQGLFCPFAYRLPPPDQGASFAKDLAAEYHYLGNTSEWFFLARKNAEKVIARNDQYIKAYHLYSNSTSREADEILSVKYDDGRWSKPYYDCGGGNIWMLTYTVPFFGYENGTYFFKGTSGIDIDLRRVDIDQCPQRNTPGATQPLNIFAGTDKCKQRTTMCEAITGLGFRRGSYKCVCRKGFYYPDTSSTQKYFNGSILEEEYEKLMLGEESTYNKLLTYECLPCAEGCDSCEDASPCVAALNWPMRTSILVLACAVIGLLPPAAWFTFRYQQVKVVRAASPALLRVIALGAFFIYCTTIVMYPPPSLYTCTARIWLREIGFSLTYGALMLKTWRISVIFRVRSAKAVKITDAALLKRLGVICGVIGACLLVRTIVSPPEVVVGRTADDLKAFLCRTDWWDYTFTSMEVLFLAWGVRLCIMVRKAPSEFNESRFISMAIYNEFLLTCFLNVSMLFLQSPANPDLLYIIFFCHTQLTVTLLLGLIFGSKVYIVLRSGKTQENAIGMGAKSSGAKFNFRPQIRAFGNPSTATTSTAQLAGNADTKLTDQEALEEIRQLSVQLQRIQELAPPKGIAVMTISSLLDGLKTTSHQISLKPPPASSLPILAINNYSHQNNKSAQQQSPIKTAEKSINTISFGDDFWMELKRKCKNCQSKIPISLPNDNIIVGDVDIVTTKTISSQQYHDKDPSSPSEHSKGGNLSFSDLQLDCMCSNSDDIDQYNFMCDDDSNWDPNNACGMQSKQMINKYNDTCSRQMHRFSNRSLNKTNIIDQTIKNSGMHKRSKTRKFYSSCNLVQSKSNNSSSCDNHKSNEHFLICDNCKSKSINNERLEIRIDSKKFSSLKYPSIKSKSQNDNNDDDGDDGDDGISFHSSNDNENDDSDTNNKGDKKIHEDNQNVEGEGSSNAKKGRNNRKSEKLVLDLNDRSKYTKEVSV